MSDLETPTVDQVEAILHQLDAAVATARRAREEAEEEAPVES